MPGDHVILTTPRDLEDAKRQLHLAVVFLCGRSYLANGTITLKGGDVQSSQIVDTIQTQASNNGVGDKMPTPALRKLPVGSTTGEYCSECCGELRRNGSCMICVSCGTTTGCS